MTCLAVSATVISLVAVEMQGFPGLTRASITRGELNDTGMAKSTTLNPGSSARTRTQTFVPLSSRDAEDVSGNVLLAAYPPREDKFDGFIALDADGDGITWTFDRKKQFGGLVTESWLEVKPLYGQTGCWDDWVFIPVEIDADNADLHLSFFASTQYRGASDVHNFKVYFGDEADPEAMTTVVMDKEGYISESTTWEYITPLETDFTASGHGICYLGIHVTSSVDSGYLRVGEITLSRSETHSEPVGPNGEIFEMHPTEEEFGMCQIIDANEDGCTICQWVVTGADGRLFDWPIHYNSLQSGTPAKGDADEWLITPAIKLSTSDKIHTLSIDALTTGSTFTDAFEIVIATEATLEGMKAGRQIMNEPAVTNEEYKTFTSRFAVETPGYYYIGIHINSLISTGWRISMKDLKVCVTEQSAMVPGPCSDLEIVPDPHGRLEATVNMTLPKLYMNSLVMPEQELVTVEVESPVDRQTVSGKPGEKVSVTIAAADGNNLIVVDTKNADGNGSQSKGQVRCGLDVPVNPVVSAKVSDDNMSLHLSWEAPVTGLNGGIVDPSAVKYRLYTYQGSGNSGGWILTVDNISTCEYTYTASSEKQELHQVMLSAYNDKGESDGGYESFASAVLGKPYPLPMNENFTGGAQAYNGLLIDYPTEEHTASWALDMPSAVGISGGPSYALMCVNMDMGKAMGYVELPRFSTAGCKKTRLKLTMYIDDFSARAEISVYGQEGREKAEIIRTIDSSAGDGWTDVFIDLPEKYDGREWVVLAINVTTFDPSQIFVLGGYEIYERHADDFGVIRIEMPPYVTLGDETGFVVTVGNRGYNTAPVPAVKARVMDGAVCLTDVEMEMPGISSLADGETIECLGRLKFDCADMYRKNLTLEVNIDNEDENPGNNVGRADFRVGIGGMPVVSDIAATLVNDGSDVMLSWDNPYAYGVVENMEAYPHGCYSGTIGRWKNIDYDGATTYVTETFYIPDAGLPKAFQVVNKMLCGMDGLLCPSGDQFLMAFSPEQAVADDWLISPQVKGGSTVSFQLTSLATEFKESVEVMWSETDDEADSFKVLESVVVEYEGWAGYEFTLPENAKYFAIHYISDDKFGICIDDITYDPVNPEVEISGYNIYRDGVKVADGHKETVYTDSDIPAGSTCDFNVAVVGTKNGVKVEFPRSATVSSPRTSSIESVNGASKTVYGGSGCIIAEGYEGASAEVFDVSGIMVAKTENLPVDYKVSLEAGIYLVVIGGESHKVAVR